MGLRGWSHNSLPTNPAWRTAAISIFVNMLSVIDEDIGSQFRTKMQIMQHGQQLQNGFQLPM